MSFSLPTSLTGTVNCGRKAQVRRYNEVPWMQALSGSAWLRHRKEAPECLLARCLVDRPPGFWEGIRGVEGETRVGVSGMSSLASLASTGRLLFVVKTYTKRLSSCQPALQYNQSSCWPPLLISGSWRQRESHQREHDNCIRRVAYGQLLRADFESLFRGGRNASRIVSQCVDTVSCDFPSAFSLDYSSQYVRVSSLTTNV